MRTLECMSTHYDGSHWGLNDWYPEIEAGIREALACDDEWTTGWYCSKKEIASCSITKTNQNEITVEASVSDDFDTNGYGDVFMVFNQKDIDYSIEAIRKAISQAWEEAEQDRKDNAIYVGYKVIKGNAWIETYILDTSGGMYGDEPPGDNYFEWGWQGDGELPDGVKEVLEKWVQSFSGEGECTCDSYTIKQWDD